MSTPPNAEITERWRRRMQTRLDRASRRFRQMNPLLSKKKEADPALEAAEVQSVGDDFSHVIGEMKTVIHYFGGWSDETGPAKQGNLRLKAWKASGRLSDQEQATLDTIREIRDFDVHHEPVEPQRKTTVALTWIATPSGPSMLPVLMEQKYVARFEFKDGRSASPRVQSFCEAAFPLLQRLINEFDRL